MAGTENFSTLVNASGEQLRNDWPEVTLYNANAFGIFVHQQADRLLWYSGGINPDTHEQLSSFSEGAAQTAINIFLREVIGRVARAELSGMPSSTLEELAGIKIRFIKTPGEAGVPAYGNIALIEFGSSSDDPISLARFDGNIHEGAFQYGLNINETVRQALAPKIVTVENLHDSDISSGMFGKAREYVNEMLLTDWQPAEDAPDDEVAQHDAITQFSGKLKQAAEAARAREQVAAERAREREEQEASFSTIVDTLIQEGRASEENRGNLTKLVKIFGLRKGALRISASVNSQTVVRQGRKKERVKIYDVRINSAEDVPSQENDAIRISRPGTQAVELRLNGEQLELAVDPKNGEVYEVHIKRLGTDDEKLVLEILAAYSGLKGEGVQKLLKEIHAIRFGESPVRRPASRPDVREALMPSATIRLIAYDAGDVSGKDGILREHRIKNTEVSDYTQGLPQELFRRLITDDQAASILRGGITRNGLEELIDRTRQQFLASYASTQQSARLIAKKILRDADRVKGGKPLFTFVPRPLMRFVEQALHEELGEQTEKPTAHNIGEMVNYAVDEPYGSAALLADNWMRRYDETRIEKDYKGFLENLQSSDPKATELLRILAVENAFSDIKQGSSVTTARGITYTPAEVDALMMRYMLDDKKIAQAITVDIMRKALVPQPLQRGYMREAIDDCLYILTSKLDVARIEELLASPQEGLSDITTRDEILTAFVQQLLEQADSQSTPGVSSDIASDPRYRISLRLLAEVKRLKDRTDVRSLPDFEKIQELVGKVGIQSI